MAFTDIQARLSIKSQLFLFGSRTQNLRRGGDIDLLWVCQPNDVDKARNAKFDLIAKIKFLSDDQKIDITVINEKDRDQNPFFKSIESDLILLC